MDDLIEPENNLPQLLAEFREFPERWERTYFSLGRVFIHENNEWWLGWYPRAIFGIIPTCRWSNEGHYGGAWTAGVLTRSFWAIRAALRARKEGGE